MRGERGFTLVGLLAIMLVIGIMTAVVAKSWKAAARAEKEEELLWRGHQYRRAIQLYYNEAVTKHNIPSNSASCYPDTLDALLKNPFNAGGQTKTLTRFLRKKYADPMTGKDDWVEVSGGDVLHIIGVHSQSGAEPLKKDNFDKDDESFRGKGRYSEWIFKYDGTAGTTPATTTPTTTMTNTAGQ